MTDDSKTEDPCAATGKPCQFTCVDEVTDADGELLSWDIYCAACLRWRDWSKEEAPSPESDG